jgi:hypothetical protein
MGNGGVQRDDNQGGESFTKQIMAERAGFEPAIGGCPIHTFQACAFNHSATSPQESRPVARWNGACLLLPAAGCKHLLVQGPETLAADVQMIVLRIALPGGLCQTLVQGRIGEQQA